MKIVTNSVGGIRPYSWQAGILGLLFCLSLVSCGTPKHHLPAGKAPVIGFSLDSLVVERWQRDLDAFSRAAQDLGAQLIVEVADQDPVVQEGQVRDLLSHGIDVLVIVPNDADRLSAVVREAKQRGIPVLSYDRLVRRAGVDLYLSFDNEKVGALMAESVSQNKEARNFIIVNGAKNDNNAIMLNQGIHAALSPAQQQGKIKVVEEIWPDTWDSEEVRNDMEAVVARNPRIDAVIAGNDMLAEAILSVLTENRLYAKVVGQDADLAACQRIAEGSQYATIYKPIVSLARKAADCAVRLARGDRIESDSSIDDGQRKVPYMRLEPILVTRGNLDSTVIKDGFHSAADVYRNVKR